MPTPPNTDVERMLQDIHRMLGGMNTSLELVKKELELARQDIRSNTQELGGLAVATREYLVQAKETHFKQIEIQGEQAKLGQRLKKIEEIFQL